MNKHISDRSLQEIFGAELSEHDLMDEKIEEAYAILRKHGKKMTGNKRRKDLIGFGSAAAALLLMFTLCVMNPVMAQEIPFLGNLFARIADVFPFGKLPEEEATMLYEETEDTNEPENAENDDSQYRKKDGALTITLTEEYASNQAIYIGICIENEQKFPEMASLADGSGLQRLLLWTTETYSFRPGQIQGARYLEGKLTDDNTFLGIMRIDYSEIEVDDSKYVQAYHEAEVNGEPLPTDDSEVLDLFDTYEVPDNFDMELDITKIKGFADGADWYLEGNWNYQLSIAQKDEASRVIMINEINEAGIGIESIEISSVEMTIDPIEPADASTIAVALDAEGRQMESGSSNLYELAIQDYDISTVYLYILDYEEYMDELKGYRLPGNEKYDSYQQILEERALFKTVVETDG